MCSPGSRPVLPPSFFIHGNSISSHAATGILRDPGCLSSPARGSLPRTQLPRAVPASRLCCQHPHGAPHGDTPAQPQLAPGLCHQPHTVGCTESPHLLPTPNILGFIPPPAFPLPFEKGSPGSTSQAHLHPPCPKPSPGKHWSPPSILDQEHKDRRGAFNPLLLPFSISGLHPFLNPTGFTPWHLTAESPEQGERWAKGSPQPPAPCPRPLATSPSPRQLCAPCPAVPPATSCTAASGGGRCHHRACLQN